MTKKTTKTETSTQQDDRVLLLDGDIIVYKCSAAVEVVVDWGGDIWSMWSDVNEAKEKAASFIAELKEKSGIQNVEVCLSGSANFRKDVDPTYKAHRKDVRKPIAFAPLKEFLRNEYLSHTTDGIEADDYMGIKASGDPRYVVWTEDKDLKGVPLTLFKLDDGFIEVSEHDANYWFMVQTLTGDQTDGYKGCPAVGIKTAEKILQKAIDEGTPWANEYDLMRLYWKHVVMAYIKAGLNEEVAIQQARLARILRHGEYENGKVKLWNPPAL